MTSFDVPQKYVIGYRNLCRRVAPQNLKFAYALHLCVLIHDAVFRANVATPTKNRLSLCVSGCHAVRTGSYIYAALLFCDAAQHWQARNRQKASATADAVQPKRCNPVKTKHSSAAGTFARSTTCRCKLPLTLFSVPWLLATLIALLRFWKRRCAWQHHCRLAAAVSCFHRPPS